ncbi:hypothetical protein AB0C77_31745, partial [Streptomyces sp. NPDC048629]
VDDTRSTGLQPSWVFLSVRTARPARRIEGMLWSDPKNEPPKEMREMQVMLRRAGFLLALAMVVAMLVAGMR